MIGSDRTDADHGISARDEATLHWLTRHRLNRMTKKDEVSFEAWMSDPANALSYEQAAVDIESFGAIASDEEVRAMRAAALSVGADRKGNRVPLRLVATMATIAIGIGTWFAVSHPGPDAPAPLIAARDELPAAAVTARRYVTKIGERSRFTLDDGSVVSLNTNSILEVAFTPDQRAVRLLQGEGLFQVAKNKHRPFIVTAGGLRTTAIGTAFDVRLDRGRVRIVLTAGRVVVDAARPAGGRGSAPAMEPISLQPGEQLSTDDTHAVIVSAADVEQATSWRQGQLIFRDEPLASALAEMNRYTSDQIIVEDPKIAKLRVSGVFSTARPENFVAAMTAFYPLEVRHPSDGAMILDWSGAKPDQ